MNKLLVLFIIPGYFLLSCSSDESDMPVVSKNTSSIYMDKAIFLASLANLNRNGKIRKWKKQDHIYETYPMDSLRLPYFDQDLVRALQQNLRLLQYRKRAINQQIGQLSVNQEQLEQVTQLLLAWQYTIPLGLNEQLEAHRLWGEDKKGNVKFTGYFTPLLKVRKKKNPTYPYPIYKRPLQWEGRLPSRTEIETMNVLSGRGLELAYAQNKVDIYYMQLQGSGYVEYPNGKKELFAYHGTNRYPYRSIEKYLMNRTDIKTPPLHIDGIKKFLKQNPQLLDTVLNANPSYTFFTPKKYRPRGAGNVPLTAEFSIAVDRRYIPLGSCLLGAFPVYDHQLKRIIKHEYRIFIAQDVGGAIKGAGHVDLYTGIGEKGKRRASRINHFGQLWLLLPKSEDRIVKN